MTVIGYLFPMRGMQWRVRHEWMRRLGWRLFALSLLLFVSSFVWRSMRASPEEFDQLAQWAQILALVTGVFGLALELLRRGSQLQVDVSARELDEIQRDLTAQALGHERGNLERLLGTDTADTVQINVAFHRQLVQYRNAGGDYVGDLDSIKDYYERLRPRRLVVSGEPGSGKTVLALYLLVCLLEERQHSADTPGKPVPIRFSLSEFDTGLPLETWITRQLVAMFSLQPKKAATLVRDRRILPVLDGLDEMDGGVSAPRRAIAAIRRMNDYTAPLIVTCRKQRYDEITARLFEATTVEIQPLGAAQVSGYIENQLRHDYEQVAWSPVLDVLANGSTNTEASALLTTLATPWRLNLAITAARDPEDPLDPSILLPSRTGFGEVASQADRLGDQLLEHYIPALTRLHPHRGTKHYDAGRVGTWLRTVAHHLEQQSSRGGSGSDLMLNTWWPTAGFHRVRFIHAGVVALTLFAALVMLAFLAASPNSESASIAISPAISFVVFLSWCILMATSHLTTRPVVSGGLEIRRLLDLRRVRSALVRSVAVGLTINVALLAAVVVSGGVSQTEVGLTTVTVVGLTLGLAVGLTLVVATQDTSSEPNEARGAEIRAGQPRDPPRLDALYGLTLGLPFTLLGAAMGAVVWLDEAGLMATKTNDLAFNSLIGLTIGWTAGLVYGPGFTFAGRFTLRSGGKFDWRPTLGLANGLLFGAVAADATLSAASVPVGIFAGILSAGIVALVLIPASLRYITAVSTLALTRRTPLAFGHFLDWAHDAGLLRVSGIAYQFRHHELQSWLVNSESAAPDHLWKRTKRSHRSPNAGAS